jgi:hypothetical protein
MNKPFRKDALAAIARFAWPKKPLWLQVLPWRGRVIMVLTPGYIKVIATEIGSQIITELRKPFKKSSGTIEATGACEAVHNNKDTPVDCFKFHERRTHKHIENESMKG